MSTVWQFTDSAGVEHEGHVTHVDDFGGTDVTYHMTAACGAYRLISGSRVKAAKVKSTQLSGATCPHVTKGVAK